MIIYKTINLLNGKIYVGKDCNHNPGYLGSGIRLQRAIAKYGKENFKKEVLEVCSAADLCVREVFWIVKLNARDPNVGYNIAVGGDGGATRTGMTNSLDMNNRISESQRGKKRSEDDKKKQSMTRRRQADLLMGSYFTEEFREKMRKLNAEKGSDPAFRRKMSLLLSGKNNPNFGKHLSKEHRMKISISKKAAGGGWKGRNFSVAQRAVLSTALKGNSYHLGCRHSLEVRKRISEACRRATFVRLFKEAA